MATNPLLVIRRFHVVELKWETLNIFTLVLAPEEGESMVSFLPGQWVYLHLLNPDGTTWARAAFSVASAPEESGEKLELCIKIYGEFTKRASKLAPLDVVGIQGPFGVFTLHEDVSPLVIFAAGVGITPFRSMIRSLAVRRSSSDVILFYTNRTIEETAHFEELTRLAKEWPALHPVFTLTGTAPRNWEGETGRINAPMVKNYVKDFERGEFLACGPVTFMDGVKAILEAEGVDTKKRFRKELFG